MEYERILYSENNQIIINNKQMNVMKWEQLLSSYSCQCLKEKNIKINTINIWGVNKKHKVMIVLQENLQQSFR